jgi:hypothetical protein
LEGSFIMGLSDQPVTSLAPLARSWLNAAKVEIRSVGFASEGFSKDERAYVFRKTTSQPQELEFIIQADPQSSLVNPGLVIRNWGDSAAELSIDGISIPRGAAFRYGYRYTMEGTDLVLWIKKDTQQNVHFSIKPIRT